MKNITIKKIATFTLITMMILGTGCAKIDQFGDTNANPNGITSPVTAALLTNVISGLGGYAANLGTGCYAQYVSENQYTETSLYSLPQFDMSGAYSGSLQDLQTIIAYNSDPATSGIAAVNGSNANQIAIARILKSFIFWQTTDRWGDIPYSQALLGASNLTPKYDMQEDVYFGIIKECKQAVASFDNGAPIKGDLLYDGNIANWKKFGNSLRMLMAMRLTKRYPAAGGKAAVEFDNAANAGHISTNSENATLVYPGGSYKCPWFSVYETRDDYASSKTLGDVLSGLGDTRSTVFGTNSVMFPYGLPRNLAIAYGNSVGSGQSRVLAVSKRLENSSIVIVSAAQVLLAKAEAKERGWIAGGSVSAEADYNAAITESYSQWGVALPAAYLSGAASYTAGAGVPGSIGAGAAPYDNFNVASNNIQDAATTTKLARIALQRWIANFPDGNQGWAEQRRTGVPNLKSSRFSTGAFVQRYVYATADYSLNNANVIAAAARLTGGDKQDSKIWWNN